MKIIKLLRDYHNYKLRKYCVKMAAKAKSGETADIIAKCLYSFIKYGK